MPMYQPCFGMGVINIVDRQHRQDLSTNNVNTVITTLRSNPKYLTSRNEWVSPNRINTHISTPYQRSSQ